MSKRHPEREPRFKKGDRVCHATNGAGTVIEVDRDRTVHVKHDQMLPSTGKHWIGIYDLRWFAIYPDVLKMESEKDA